MGVEMDHVYILQRSNYYGNAISGVFRNLDDAKISAENVTNWFKYHDTDHQWHSDSGEYFITRRKLR